MREILFKAKRVDNGEWVEGDLQHNEIGDTWISKLTSDLNGLGGLFENVDSKTVCQFTGLTDKNGVKIFEYDKVEGRNGRVTKFGDIYEIISLSIAERHWFSDVKVIGNIHDK